jgi:hypothetical protein
VDVASCGKVQKGGFEFFLLVGNSDITWSFLLSEKMCVRAPLPLSL